ncbi:hypothetical protein GCM10025868_12630 [Angustibacter aerolatus]|uniref:Uncharacterized protein n=1 Tax=Angustibacter aerolatus TaxID=1162965 RepID=A0ABQ6JF16_9ACTN|nr:hypothetical protein GCM10025868_12630 [Angustibacter aerolatus]
MLPSARAATRSPRHGLWLLTRWITTPPPLHVGVGEVEAEHLAGLRAPAVLEGDPQPRAAAVDARAHRAELHPERGRDLLVGEALDVAQHDGGAEVRLQRVEGGLHVVVEVGVLVDARRVGLAAGQLVARVVGERVEAHPLLAAHLVEEEVRGDAVQPALEGAGRVRRQAAEDADERLLGEVLGVVHVAGEAVGEPVHPRGVLADDLLPGGRRPGNGVRGVHARTSADRREPRCGHPGLLQCVAPARHGRVG